MFQFINNNPNICVCVFISVVCYFTFLRRQVEHFAFIGSLIRRAINAVLSPLIRYVKGLIMRIFKRVSAFASKTLGELARSVGRTIYSGIMKIVNIIRKTAAVVIKKVKEIIRPYFKPLAIGTGIFLSWLLIFIWFLILEPIVFPDPIKMPAPPIADVPSI